MSSAEKEKAVEALREWIIAKTGKANPTSLEIVECCRGLPYGINPDLDLTVSCLGGQLADSMVNSWMEDMGDEEGLPDIGYIEAHLSGVWEDIRARLKQTAPSAADDYDGFAIRMVPRIRAGVDRV
jgi:hypothetical protein